MVGACAVPPSTAPATRDTCHRPVTPELDTERMSTASTRAPGTAGSPAPRGPPCRGQGRSWCRDLETQWLSDRNKGQRPSPSGLMAGDEGSCDWMLPRKWQGKGLGEAPCSYAHPGLTCHILILKPLFLGTQKDSGMPQGHPAFSQGPGGEVGELLPGTPSAQNGGGGKTGTELGAGTGSLPLTEPASLVEQHHVRRSKRKLGHSKISSFSR